MKLKHQNYYDNLDGQEVILVDHNEFQQSAETISDAEIKHVVIIIEFALETFHRFGTAQNQLVVPATSLQNVQRTWL